MQQRFATDERSLKYGSMNNLRFSTYPFFLFFPVPYVQPSRWLFWFYIFEDAHNPIAFSHYTPYMRLNPPEKAVLAGADAHSLLRAPFRASGNLHDFVNDAAAIHCPCGACFKMRVSNYM
jgi:hypothetical protein